MNIDEIERRAYLANDTATLAVIAIAEDCTTETATEEWEDDREELEVELHEVKADLTELRGNVSELIDALKGHNPDGLSPGGVQTLAKILTEMVTDPEGGFTNAIEDLFYEESEHASPWP